MLIRYSSVNRPEGHFAKLKSNREGRSFKIFFPLGNATMRFFTLENKQTWAKEYIVKKKG